MRETLNLSEPGDRRFALAIMDVLSVTYRGHIWEAWDVALFNSIQRSRIMKRFSDETSLTVEELAAFCDSHIESVAREVAEKEKAPT